MNSMNNFFAYSKEKVAAALNLKEPKVEPPKTWYDKMYLSLMETKKTTCEYLNSLNKSLKTKSYEGFSSFFTFYGNEKYASYPWYKRLYYAIKDEILYLFGSFPNKTKEITHENEETDDSTTIVEESKSCDEKPNEKNRIQNICSSIKSSEISFRKRFLNISKSGSLTSDEVSEKLSLKDRISHNLYKKISSDNAINSSFLSKRSSSTDMIQDASSNANSEIHEETIIESTIQIEKDTTKKTAATFSETFFKNTWATISRIVP